MSEIDAVLFANEAFYQAFTERDPEAMDTIWSQSAPVTCLHPGWGPLVGREQVMESWFAIIRNPQSPNIRCLDARAFLYGDTASVICFEVIDGNVLIATNLFVRTGKVWKMTHHQAGPTSARPRAAPDERQGPVN